MGIEKVNFSRAGRVRCRRGEEFPGGGTSFKKLSQGDSKKTASSSYVQNPPTTEYTYMRYMCV